MKTVNLKDMDCERWISKEGMVDKINYDGFTFMDNITNNKIIMEDARRSFEQPMKRIDNAQARNLATCVSTLRTTKLFQLNSLKMKIFKSMKEESSPTDPNPKPTPPLSTIIQDWANQMDRQELEKCFNIPQHRVDPKLLDLRRMLGNNHSPQYIMEVIRKIKNGESEPAAIIKPKITIEQCQFTEGNRILERAKDYMYNTIHRNSTLLTHKPKKDLLRRLRTACSNKEKKQITHNSFYQNDTYNCTFNPIKLSPQLQMLRKKKTYKENKNLEIENVIAAANLGLNYEVVSMINQNNSLLKAKDSKGNNILHVCAKNRNTQLFQMLFRKWRNGIYQCNNLSKTPQYIAQIYGAQQIINIIGKYRRGESSVQ